MKKSAFGLMASAVLILSSCTNFDEGSKPSGEVVHYYPKYEQQEITLFTVGRTLSNNRVDIYDPAASTLDIPPDAPKAQSPLAAFPAHPHLLIKDEDVVVYSLYSASVLDEMLQPPEDGIMAPPVPLTGDESMLPP